METYKHWQLLSAVFFFPFYNDCKFTEGCDMVWPKWKHGWDTPICAAKAVRRECGMWQVKICTLKWVIFYWLDWHSSNCTIISTLDLCFFSFAFDHLWHCSEPRADSCTGLYNMTNPGVTWYFKSQNFAFLSLIWVILMIQGLPLGKLLITKLIQTSHFVTF